jgi:hypothetical protein
MLHLFANTVIHRLLITLLLIPFLAGCGSLVTYADVQQTAQAGGCWPNRPAYRTPLPVTVTPASPLTPTPDGFVWPIGVPTPTHLPTTTPYPRCPPVAGEELEPWPTPVPAEPPFPTMIDTHAGGSSGQRTTLQLPEIVLTTDIAVHPTEGWPAVAAAVWSGNDNPERAFVSVYNPNTRTWTPAHQVDIGASALGRYTRTVEVAITGDGVVHAVWGMSDPDFSDNDPPSGVWAAESHDYGMTWSTPQRIGSDCRQVNDMAATLQGWLVVGLVCHAGIDQVRPAIATRNPQGVWSLDRLPGAIWYFSEGAVAITDDADQGRATVIFLTGPNGAMTGPPRVLLYAKHLGSSAPWQLTHRDVTVGNSDSGARTWHARDLVYRPEGAPHDFVSFTFSSTDTWNVYAITSQDGGQTWLPTEVAAAPLNAGDQVAFAAPAYDPIGNRLLLTWTCCTAGGWSDATPSTHYLRWTTPGSGQWRDPTPGQRIPLVLGSRSAGETVIAQARNAHTGWIAWIEGGKSVEVRSFDFATVLPRP